MKPIVVEFVGGSWDGRSLRSDSMDREESLLASACYEMTHHGAIGQECPGLSSDTVEFARIHEWAAAREQTWPGNPRYRVAERRETEAEMVIQLHYVPAAAGNVPAASRPKLPEASVKS